jgi:hypothetical protein
MSNEYSSVLAPYISGLVATKRAVGYTYETAEFYLRDFDRYCCLRAECRSLSRELVLEWVKAKDGESPRTHRTRISPIRELGKYGSSGFRVGMIWGERVIKAGGQSELPPPAVPGTLGSL